MSLAVWYTIGMGALGASAATILVEQLAAADRSKLRWSRVLAAAAVGLALYLAFFLILFRPFMAAQVAVGFVIGCHIVSAIKQRMLGEPLVFSDFYLIKNVIRFPQLYYADLRQAPWIVVAGSLIVVAFFGNLWLESSIWKSPATVWFAALMGAGSVAMLVMLAVRSTWINAAARKLAEVPNLTADVQRLGLIATLIIYWVRFLSDRETERHQAATKHATEPVQFEGEGVDCVIVIQLESFIDPNCLKLPKNLIPEMPGLERLRSIALMHGDLVVPAHGAYTMRTEAGVVTGLDPDDLGFEQFDPYLSVGYPRTPSLAKKMKASGFETIFVHPFHGEFFDRRSVMRRMGFEKQAFLESFESDSRFGPYVGDHTLIERIGTLATSGKPRFIFAVSMENHGPWPDGRLAGQAGGLSTYLTHLRNSDRAILAILDQIEESNLNALLCLYGDHRPILPNYVDDTSTTTPYAIAMTRNGIWAKHTERSSEPAKPGSITSGRLGRILGTVSARFEPAGYHQSSRKLADSYREAAR